MSVENRLWVLMGKKLSGSITEPEDIELDNLFQTYPDVWYTYEVLTGVDDKEIIPDAFIKELKTLLDYNEDTATIAEVKPDDDKPSKIKILPVWIKIAAAAMIVVAILLGGTGIYHYLRADNFDTSKNNEIVTLNGAKTDVQLPDGSRVIINSGSTLTYSKNYATSKIREVFLSGEAYFKVLHDKQHPFIIHTPHFDIRDIGTTFNIKAYPGEKIAEASLLDGSIEISFKDSRAKKILLQPKQKVVLINNAANSEAVKALAADKQPVNYKVVELSVNNNVKSDFAETAWVNNELVFRNEVFESLAKKMERKYNVEISFGDEKIKTSNVTGLFKNETIDQALKELQLITPFKYEIDENKILIRSTGTNL